MKIWRKSRLSECHANLFANGRVRAIYVNILVMCAAMLSLASCSSDDDYKFDASKLEGKWRKAIRSAWPDEGWKTTDLNYRVGETGHMNIFTGKTYNGDSKIYLEVDVRKLTDSEMVWYHTDSNEEIARFTKEK